MVVAEVDLRGVATTVPDLLTFQHLLKSVFLRRRRLTLCFARGMVCCSFVNELELDIADAFSLLDFGNLFASDKLAHNNTSNCFMTSKIVPWWIDRHVVNGSYDTLWSFTAGHKCVADTFQIPIVLPKTVSMFLPLKFIL
jgi:hypothetical protein